MASIQREYWCNAVNNYIGLGRLAACRDEKFMNVSNVKVFDEEHLVQYEKNRIYILKCLQDVAQQGHVFSVCIQTLVLRYTRSVWLRCKRIQICTWTPSAIGFRLEADNTFTSNWINCVTREIVF